MQLYFIFSKIHLYSKTNLWKILFLIIQGPPKLRIYTYLNGTVYYWYLIVIFIQNKTGEKYDNNKIAIMQGNYGNLKTQK